MRKSKILSLIISSVVFTLLTINCSNEDEAIQQSLTDVSSRVSGFNSDITGAGASLTINGSQLSNVQRIAFGNLVVPLKSFTAITDSNITFNVPAQAPVGVNDVLLVFPGSERAFTAIEVVPLQVVGSFHPYAAIAGEVITIFGANLDIVNTVSLGSVIATVSQQTDDMIKFTVPSGISTGKITLTSPAGVVNSTEDLIACEAEATSIDCKTSLTLNSGFELGTGDNFDNWSKFNGGTLMVATTSPNEVYRGDRALKVIRDGTLSSGQWRIQLASDLVTWEIGASYTVYIWAKASAAGGSMRVSTNPNAMYTGDQAITTSWQRLAFTFSSANEASTRVVLDMNGNNTAATTFFIDEVRLLKN